jgi:homoserine kinase
MLHSGLTQMQILAEPKTENREAFGLGSEKGAAAAGVKQADTLTDVVISDSEMVALCNIMNQGMKKYN